MLRIGELVAQRPALAELQVSSRARRVARPTDARAQQQFAALDERGADASSAAPPVDAGSAPPPPPPRTLENVVLAQVARRRSALQLDAEVVDRASKL